MLAPESAISTDIQAAINNWSTLTLNTVRILLRQSLPSLALDYTATFLEYYGVEFSRRIRTYPPIPEMFLQGLDALLLCTEKVDLFTNIWFTHCNGEITDENLMSVREMWMKLFQSLLSGEISYSYLESNLRYLSDSNELCVLVQTCLEPQGWNYLEKTNIKVQELVSALQLKLKKWRKVQNLIQAKEYLLSVIDVASQAVLNESGVADIRNWGSQLEFLCRAVVNIGEWNSQTLNDLDKYWEFAEILDERMLRVSLNLLVSIRDNSPILTFMRIIRDDNAFTSSLEVALGLQEMECPAELWDTEHGRVDEKFLSMARNIRSYLYNYLYQYPPSLSTTRSFLELFSNLNEAMSPDTVAENIYECNRVRDAFMEIMQFKSDGASSSRLLKLYEPKCRSHWVLRYGGNSKSTKEKPGLQLDINEEFQRLHGHELTLEYVTVTGNLDVQEKQQSHALPELLDFQSNIVLSKEGSVLGGVFQETVDKFLHQLGWIRKLREVFSQLSAAGHFSYYPSYFISLSVQLDDNYFVEEVSKSQSILDNWVNLVSLMRKRYYFLNYFDIKRCYSLLSALHKYSEDIESNNLCVGDNTATFRDVVSILQSFISFINSDASSFQDIASFAREFCSLWFSQRPPGGLTATHLEPLCHCLHNCCSAIVPRCRPVYVNFDLENYVTLPALKNATIYTVCASSSKVEFEQALTLYISRKVWPEWETCLVCTKNTSLEIVNNFINRWRSSHANNRQNRLYYLLCCHLLPYHIQEAVCNMLREFQYETSFAPSEGTLGPLVLSCKGAAHSNPLIALFHNMNLAVSVLPDHLISHLFNCESGGRQVEVFCGKRAGCGKTFNILTKCSVESYQYVYVPVNGAVNKPVELKNFLNRIINTPKSTSTNELPPLYHFDIANTVKDTFASFLFEFCVLGIVPDLEGENAVTVPPRSAICIELAASMLDATLPHCRVYPLHWCRASRDTFQFSEESLRCGMGEQFSSPLYDGTWKIADSRLQVAADAFTRLRYVTVALNVLRYGKGTFPYDFRVLDPSQSNPPDAQNISFLTSSNNSNTSHQTLEIKEKSGESREQLTQRKVYEKLLMTGHGLDGRVAFDLLFDAMTNCNKTSEGEILQTQQNTQVSLWCMWNFVNVVYWQLVEMHHIDSPLNGACMPDANAGDRTLEEDTRTKRKIKGEIIYFILRTAVEFATRQSKLKHFSDSIVEVSVTGMKRSLFNKRWRRMEYDSDGKPCFRSPCGNFYLYYRALADCWVIDDIIETSGSTYAYSQSGDINSLWTSSPEWSRSSIIESKFETTANSAAYRGEAVRISGCGRLGGKTYCSAAEDGLYLRQPPYDDINGHPHYIKYTSPNDPLRRHLFFASERRWIVAPQCNEDQGYFIMGDGSAASRNWMYLPPDEVERQTSFTFIQRGTEGQEILRDEDDSSIDEYDIELVRWKDSNHECILFNNVAHTVAFLSARPKEMKNRLHPMLLRHLEQNSISVEGGTGRDDTFASSHWKTLSALTGVHKDDSQASKVGCVPTLFMSPSSWMAVTVSPGTLYLKFWLSFIGKAHPSLPHMLLGSHAEYL